MNNNLERAKKTLRSRKGFSLVELIIVIAIMAALVAILAPQYIKYVDNSRKTADKNTAEEIFTACKVATTESSLTTGFYAEWDGNNLTIYNITAAGAKDTSVNSTAAGLIATNLGTSQASGVIDIDAKYKGTITGSEYAVAYVYSTTCIATGGWWPGI